MKKILLATAILVSTSTMAAKVTASAVNAAMASAPVKANTTATTIVGGVFLAKDLICPESLPCGIVKSTTTQVLEAVNKNSPDSIIQAIVSNQFDFELMTKYALGNNWKTATPVQQQQLVVLFKQLLIYTYSSAISKFKAAQITITSNSIKERLAAVKSQVVLPNTNNNQPVTVEYDLAKTKTGWKAYDIKIENASLVTTYRTQFNDVIQSSKVDGLIKQLKAKIASLQATAKNN